MVDPAAARGAAIRAAAAAQVFVTDPGAPSLDGAQAHHLSRVLRLRDGEAVVAADGRGAWSLCRFKNGGEIEVDGATRSEDRTEPALTVAFAPTKGDRPEWVVQKLTELGVDHIVLVHADHSVVEWRGERDEKHLSRLVRIAQEAAAQSRQVWLPTLAGSRPIRDVVAEGCALAQLGGDAPSLAHPAVAIGPEGGWSDSELALEAPHVGFGPSVLRAETAAVAAGTLLCALRAGTVGARADAPEGPSASGR